MRTKDGRHLLIGGVIAAGCVVILGVLAAGPVLFEAPRWLPTPAEPTPIEPPGAIAGDRPEAVEPNPIVAQVIAIVLAVLLVATVTVLVVALVVLLVRRFRGRRRLVRRQSAPGTLGGGLVSAAGAVVPVEAMRSGIARALRAIDDDRVPSDAVIQAWLGLEQTATEAGAERAASETPAEYTARLVMRFDTDRDAARALLGLYHEARFGGRTADASSVAAARDSLLRLQRSWHEVGVE